MARRKWFKLRRVVEEVVFGVEDSLVSTLGAITGIAAGTQSTYIVILSGIVLLFAEATSMTAGSYLSSKSEGEVWLQEHESDWDELMKKQGVGRGPVHAVLKQERVKQETSYAILQAIEVQRRRWLGQIIRHERASSPSGNQAPVFAASVMGVSYLLAGIIPLGAYFIFPVRMAIPISVVVTLIALFAFGVWKASLTRQSKWKSGLEMLAIAGAAAGIAYVLGYVVRQMFGVVI
ncbi:hypothetical protein COV06_03185 [Candidatus Uhrbacteria bacterium CG10_big_fil_rev_8_21_14_0_10_50_16]|uniref:Iron transporter n=1 Tax=Candidatus Uhrbacteria bacterium CG10_big_fil_rev_8_21_14_0_10_50_16 TaxID=1975039 RepID=A0A2H0RLX6_9BACT|nr:MAG: hypothetical protein COV06_03185 [Candidatus Uhrbacteria bacterium CG10_big_fil_rev_8_21_14_0_10_50_16]